MRLRVLIALLLAGCSSRDGAPAPDGTSSASAQPEAPLFDIHRFCDDTIAVGRRCEGDDDLLEGNKIGLCTTTLDDARREGITLDAKLAPACIDAVTAGKPLPDLRTLETLVARFPACRTLLSPIAALAKVEPRPAGTAKPGEPCQSSADCTPDAFCTPAGSPKPKSAGKKNATCAPKKKAGSSCATSDECLGRCSAQAGKQCVAYCGSG